MKTQQKTNNGQVLEIEDINYKNLGCDCEQIAGSVKYKCGNLINGFAYFCEKCERKKELRR